LGATRPGTRPRVSWPHPPTLTLTLTQPLVLPLTLALPGTPTLTLALTLSLTLTEVHGANSGTKMTAIVKGMQPSDKTGHIAMYKDFSISSLPEAPTAAGFRPGACDTLACAIPAEIMVHTTGHDLTGLSALFEYLGARVSLVMAGALVLAGWPPMPRGELGRGPTPPSLGAIPGLSESALNNYADLLFNLRPMSPPFLLPGGTLRPLVLDALAVLIMYYAERFAANEMTSVLNAMRSKFTAMSLPGSGAHNTLLEWSSLIKAKFTNDNLHLTGGLAGSGAAQVVTAVQQMASTVSHLHTTVVQLASEMANIKSELVSLRGSVRRAASPTTAVATPAAAATPAAISTPAEGGTAIDVARAAETAALQAYARARAATIRVAEAAPGSAAATPGRAQAAADAADALDEEEEVTLTLALTLPGPSPNPPSSPLPYPYQDADAEAEAAAGRAAAASAASFAQLGQPTLGAAPMPYLTSGALARDLFLDGMLEGMQSIKASSLSFNLYPNLNPIPHFYPSPSLGPSGEVGCRVALPASLRLLFCHGHRGGVGHLEGQAPRHGRLPGGGDAHREEPGQAAHPGVHGQVRERPQDPHYELRPRQVSSHQLRGLPCQQDGHRPLQASPFTPLTLPTKPNPNLNLALTPTQPPLGRPSSAFAPLAPTAASRLA